MTGSATAAPRAPHGTGDDYRPDIDGLRAVAVLAVLGYHAFRTRVSGGFVGVDVFFVISGFLITSIILRGVETGRFSFRTFYARRVRRIFPALLIVLAFCAVAGWRELWVNEYTVLGKHIAGAAAFVSNIVLWRESGYFDATSDSKPLLHLWSLGIEEQFYLVWPLLIWLAFRVRRGVALLLTVALVASFVWCLRLTATDRTAAFFLPFSRFWELMIGAALAYASVHRRLHLPSTVRHALSVLGVLLIGVAVLRFDGSSAFPGWIALLPTLGTAALVVAGPDAGINRYALSPRPVVFVGRISYPLYLWHWPLLAFLGIASAQPPSAAMRAGVLLLSVACAWITYRLVEQPLRLQPARRVALPLVGALAVVGIAGVGLAGSSGIPGRFPRNVRSIDQYALMSDDIAHAWRRHRCMLESEAHFAPECVEAAPASAPLVVLWGDSHAAALYPGLRAQQRRYDFRIAQFSTSRCPPITGYVSPKPDIRNPNCLGVNDFVAREIHSLAPHTVIMTAYWDLYAYDPHALAATLTSLRAAGVQDVVVVGNVPIWRGNPARILFHLYRAAASKGVPERVSATTFHVPYASDTTVARAARDAGARFVSTLDPLCDQRSCLVLAGDSVVYSNADHLAPPGARYVVERLAPSIFSGVARAHADKNTPPDSAARFEGRRRVGFGRVELPSSCSSPVRNSRRMHNSRATCWAVARLGAGRIARIDRRP